MSVHPETLEDESANDVEALHFGNVSHAENDDDGSKNEAALEVLTEEEGMQKNQIGTPGTSSRKRKADASEIDVPAKQPTAALVSEEAEAMLRTVVSSINRTMLELMGLPCADVAARGRLVADLAESKRQLNDVLGIKQRVTSLLATSDGILGVFEFVRREELDALQIVTRLFSAITEDKMKLKCLRRLNSAKIERSKADNQFMLVMDEFGANKNTRLPTGVDDEAAAMTLLLDACRSSRLHTLHLYGTTPISEHFLDSLEQRAPTIFLNTFYMGNRILAEGVTHHKVLRVLKALAELKTTIVNTAWKYTNLQDCLIRNGFKAGVSLVSSGPILDKTLDTAIVEEAFLEFSFGACDERYAARERVLRMSFHKSLRSDFLRRWIQKAEVHNGLHKLTLNVTTHEALPLSVEALDAFKQDGENDGELRFRSASGRDWEVTYSTDAKNISFKIHH